jgi:hypothetical protein
MSLKMTNDPPSMIAARQANDELSGRLIPKSNSTIDQSQRTAAKVAGFAGLLAVAIVFVLG